MKPQTQNAGAAVERTCFLRELNRVEKGIAKRRSTLDVIEYLRGWVYRRSARYNKRPGGLGRKRK